METFSMFFQEGQQMQKGKAWTNLLHHFHENECLTLLTFSSAMTHSLTLHCQKRGLPHASLLQHGDDHTHFHLSRVVSDYTCKIIMDEYINYVLKMLVCS